MDDDFESIVDEKIAPCPEFSRAQPRIGEVAVVRARYAPTHARENGLRVSMADAPAVLEACGRWKSARAAPHLRFFEALGDEAHGATDPRPTDFVNRDDAG
jgi:hypothetical protein